MPYRVHPSKLTEIFNERDELGATSTFLDNHQAAYIKMY